MSLTLFILLQTHKNLDKRVIEAVYLFVVCFFHVLRGNAYLLLGFVPLVRVSSNVFVCTSMSHTFFRWLEMATFFDCGLS